MVGRFRSRFFLFALVAAMGASASADELDAKVSLTTAARSTKSIIEDLGKQASVNLFTTTTTANEPLILAVKDATLRETMDRIAGAIGGEWQKEASGYRLIRTQKQLDDQRALVVSEEAKSIKKKLDSLRTDLDKFGAYSPERAKTEIEKEQKNMEMIQNRNGNFTGEGPRFEQVVTPSLWVLRKIALSFDPTFLAQLPRRSRSVFALSPTSMQRQMPNAARSLLSNFVNLHNNYAKQASAAPKSGDDNQVIIIGDQRTGRPFDTIGEAFLTVYRDLNGTIFFGLAVADTKGEVVSDSSYVLNLSDDAANQQPVDAAPGEDLDRIGISDESKKHASLLQYTPSAAGSDIMMFRTGGGTRSVAAVTVMAGGPLQPSAPKPAIDAHWREILLHPEKYDPLSFAASEFMLRSADKLNVNLVANLEDAAAYRYSMRGAENLRPSDVLGLATNGLNCVVEKTGNWMTVRPKLLELARARRTERFAFANLMQSIDKEGRLSLDSLGAYAMKLTSPYAQGGFADRYVGLVQGAARSQFTDGLGRQFDLLRLWGSLDAVRRRQLLEGGSLQLNILSAEQRASVNSIVFHSMQGPEIDRPSPTGEPQMMSRSVQRFSAGPSFSIGSDIEFVGDERTEFMPGGLPFDGFIKIETSSEDAIFATSPNLDEGKFFSAQEYGLFQSLSANTNLQGAGQMPQYEKFKMAKRMTYEVQVHLNKLARTTGMMRDAALNPNQQSVAYEQLPESFRKDVESMKGSMRFGGPPSPPPGNGF